MYYGKCTKENLSNSIKTGVMPLIQALEAAMNNDLLLEDEKDTMYFAADTRELLRGDLSGVLL